MPSLRTERLLLRDFIPSDVRGVHAYAADREVCRYMDWGPSTLAQTQPGCAPPAVARLIDRVPDVGVVVRGRPLAEVLNHGYDALGGRE